ncbi:condensation domain-containing protein, partial [Cellvibrio mixtus]|uniref:condensation domain-containing protein n=1 Tax=Cellvibrio mixtus TaxID=39650 RepID=UPI000587E833
IYTSGSTGNPKGVMIEHHAVINLTRAIQCMDLTLPGKQWGWNASYAFDASIKGITQLISGSGLHVISEECRQDPSLLVSQLDNLSVIDCTPLMVEAWFAAGIEEHLPNLILGGESISTRLWNLLCEWQEKYNKKAVNVYGPTECTVDATWCHISKKEPHIGKLLNNVQAYILDGNNELLAQGVCGELHIGGVGLARGYLNHPDLTAEKFIRNPFYDKANPNNSERIYKTGDLVRWLPDGNLKFLGRIDHQIKIRGFRVELGEIENTLASHDDVKDALVVVKESASGDKFLVGYLVVDNAHIEADSENNSSTLIEILRLHLQKTLPDYMVPSVLVLLDQFPVTPNGKVDRTALPEPDMESQRERYVAPRTKTEKIICDIWKDVLGVERVSATDNFFQLGGHSLLVMQVMSRLQKRGLSITAKQLFAAPSVAGLAEELEGEIKIPGFPFITPANLIPEGCECITPEMLPLVNLSPDEIARVVKKIPGGASNVQDIYSLSPLQEGILFHHTINSNDAYVIPMLFKIQERKALDEFLVALQFVIDRHDVLRTAFFWDELSVPVQVVFRRASLPVQWLNFSACQDVEAEMRARCAPERQGMELGQAPLVRLQIAVDARSNFYYVLVQLHHIISDHVSLDIIQNELTAFLNGQQDNLPAPVSYREFIAHTRHHARQHDAKIFFTNMLNDLDEPTLPFGLVNVNMDGDGSHIVERKANVPSAISSRIRKLSKQLAVSPAVLFHAAWAMVVSGCSGRNDVVFGTVMSGRLQGIAHAESMPGMFINTQPVRVKLMNATALELVHQVQESLRDLLPYEQASLALAQRCSGFPGDVPLFSAMLNYRHSVPADSNRANHVGISNNFLDQHSQFELLLTQERSNYPFNLLVDDYGDSFALGIQVDQRINAIQIEKYTQTALANLVDALASWPDKQATSLSIIPEQERQQLLVEWNSTAASYPREKCIHELFEA